MPQVKSTEVKYGTSTSLTDGTYNLDIQKSSVKITGEYVKGPTEEATISFDSGSVMVASGQPFTGTFDVDLTTLTADSNLVFENYIKGRELLNVDENPTAVFIIRSVISAPNVATTTGKYIIEGKLTVKGVTNALSFPVTMSQDGRRIYADSSFAINRAEWGLDANTELRNAVLVDVHIEATRK